MDVAICGGGGIGWPMAVRRPKSAPKEQRRISLPTALWKILDEIVDIQDAATKLSGLGAYAVSDALEEAAEQYVRDLVREIGPIPPPEDVAGRQGYAKRLAEANEQAIRDDLLKQ